MEAAPASSELFDDENGFHEWNASGGRAESPAMINLSLRDPAREVFLALGRVVVVTFDDQDDVRYSTIEDLRGFLDAAPELAGLIQVAADAVETYDPAREAVVMESRYEAVSVFLVREGEVVTLGTLAFVTPT